MSQRRHPEASPTDSPRTAPDEAARIVADWPDLTAEQRHGIARALAPSVEEVRRADLGLVTTAA